MNTAALPLVSVLTPVYNGADHLVECIESVLAQTYPNWDYTILNNCSTDETLAIAQRYAATDPRIRVVSNSQFLGIVENHNRAARMISPESKYCKFVFADDWIYPNCIAEMVQVAEQHPSIGIVGAYTMDGRSVRWHGPPYPAYRIPGTEVCRSQLLGGPYVFGTLTSLLLRSDLIRKRANLLSGQHLQVDMEACFDLLQESDFGFIHQVLSFGRERGGGADSLAANLASHGLGHFIIFLKYGPVLLDKTEYEQRWKKVRAQYYRTLAHNVLRFRPKQFWKYHQDMLAPYGGRIEFWPLITSVFSEAASQLSHPLNALRGVRRWWSSAVRTADGERAEHYQQSIRKEVLDGKQLAPTNSLELKGRRMD